MQKVYHTVCSGLLDKVLAAEIRIKVDESRPWQLTSVGLIHQLFETAVEKDDRIVDLFVAPASTSIVTRQLIGYAPYLPNSSHNNFPCSQVVERLHTKWARA